MSDSPVAIRAIALSEAVKSVATSGASPSVIVEVAQTFLDFLNSTEVPAAKPAPKAVAKVKEVKGKEPEPVVETPKGPTKVQVGEAVEKMLGANKRDEAVALMKTFKAASVSTLKESDYAAFLEGADAILMTA